jgi:hypothetical protein
LAEACGFDPLSRVSELALAVPEEGDKGELGVAAHVDLSTDELSRCADALADRRGGKVETLVVGHFTVVEDKHASEGSAPPRIGYGTGGLLVAGRGAWFDAMLAAANRARPSVQDAPGHAGLRSLLLARMGRPPTVLVTALLPRSVRDRIKSEMGAEVGGSQALMAGVLGVGSVGLALRAGGPGQDVEAAAELLCDTGEACAAVEKLILKKRLEWSKELMLRVVGLGPLLDSIDVKKQDAPSPRVEIRAKMQADALAATLERVLRFAGARAQPAP